MSEDSKILKTRIQNLVVHPGDTIYESFKNGSIILKEGEMAVIYDDVDYLPYIYYGDGVNSIEYLHRFACYIETLPNPVLNKTLLTYNGSTQTVTVSNVDRSKINVTGNTGKNPGNYSAIVQVKNARRSKFSNNTIIQTLEWTITTSSEGNISGTIDLSSSISQCTINCTTNVACKISGVQFKTVEGEPFEALSATVSKTNSTNHEIQIRKVDNFYSKFDGKELFDITSVSSLSVTISFEIGVDPITATLSTVIGLDFDRLSWYKLVEYARCGGQLPQNYTRTIVSDIDDAIAVGGDVDGEVFKSGDSLYARFLTSTLFGIYNDLNNLYSFENQTFIEKFRASTYLDSDVFDQYWNDSSHDLGMFRNALENLIYTNCGVSSDIYTLRMATSSDYNQHNIQSYQQNGSNYVLWARNRTIRTEGGTTTTTQYFSNGIIWELSSGSNNWGDYATTDVDKIILNDTTYSATSCATLLLVEIQPSNTK